MSRIVVVEVTPEDIAAGVPSECTACPIALAMQRAGFASPEANDGFVSWWSGIGREYVPTPESADDFILAFDRVSGKKHARPFTFEIDLDAAQLQGEDSEAVQLVVGEPPGWNELELPGKVQS